MAKKKPSAGATRSTPAGKTARPRIQPGERVAVGLMSGTSADGVDAAVIATRGTGLSLKYRLIGMHERPYPPALRKRVLETMAPARVSVESICQLNFELAEFFAAAAIEAIDKSGLPRAKVTVVGSHGQTVCHLPPGEDRPTGSTLQLADPGVIAARCGLTTVGDFRTADMAVGGQGAPLVPITDWLMFAHPKISRVILNIGGIANLTWLGAGGKPADLLAFDTGPGNCLLDTVAQIATRGRLQFDKDGHMAAEGQVLTEFLVDWLQHPYLKRRPPKSTGREEFSRPLVERWLRHVLRAGATVEDMMATLTEFTATSIANAIRDFVTGPVDEVIAYGGGSTNPTLMAALAQLLAQPIKRIEQLGMHPKAKEAVSFALLALLRIDRVPGNVRRATGASRPMILGGVFRA